MRKRIILLPGTVTSKRDGDRHFISDQRLRRLYNVLDTDIVKVISSVKDDVAFPNLQRKVEGWIELGPRYDGKYYDIHAND